jgi:hypothetical protein
MNAVQMSGRTGFNAPPTIAGLILAATEITDNAD